MRIPMLVHVTLFSLWLGLPAWAAPRILPPPPVPETAAPAGGASRYRPVMPPAVPRGQLLYENHCMSCHESTVHIRTRQQAKSLPQLQARVRYWADYLQVHWDREEVEDVVNHLNSQYYRFERR
jgi:hypothetical protein